MLFRSLCPFTTTLAFATQAVEAGCELALNAPVRGARASGGDPARKGADFRWVSAELRNLDASTDGDVRRRKLNRPTGKGNESSPCQANPGSNVPCRSGDNPLWERLEPDDGQPSRPVLRGLGFGNEARLPA